MIGKRSGVKGITVIAAAAASLFSRGRRDPPTPTARQEAPRFRLSKPEAVPEQAPARAPNQQASTGPVTDSSAFNI
jgi:hypothetical protein